MYSGNTVSYKTIVNKLFRDFPFEEKFNDEECLEWLAEFMAHANSGVVMESKIAYIDIKDGRGDLPFDLHKIKQVATVTNVIDAEDALCGKGHIHPMRWATDNFHKRYHSDDRDYTTQSINTYTVGQNFIFPSFSCGVVGIAYEAIPTDEEGYPTIPAEQQWLEGATNYIAAKIAKKLWLKNELASDKYREIDKDRDWYFSQAVNHSKQLNGVDDAESFKNQMVRTIPSIQDHASFFANMQLPEQRYFRGASNTTISLNNATGLLNGIPNTATVGTTNTASPTLITGIASSITQTTASCANQITSYGGSAITTHGICYSTSPDPTLLDSNVNLGPVSVVGAFVTPLTGLLAGTTYYVRAFASNGQGTFYGNEITFTTLP